MMRPEELEALVKAQGVMIRGLVQKHGQPGEPLARLVADGVKPINEAFNKANDRLGQAAFKVEMDRLLASIPSGQ